MILVGDIRLAGAQDRREPFEFVRRQLSEHDVAFGNLEGALVDEIDPYEYYSKFQWKHAGVAGAQALAGAFAAVGLANNVIVGEQAILSTVSTLDEMGIAHTGAGADLAAARAPAIVEHDGVRYGFLQRTSIFWPYRHRAVPSGPVPVPTGDALRYFHGLPFAPDGVVDMPGAPGVATIRPHTAYEPSFSMMFEGGGDAIVHTWPDASQMEEFLADIRALRDSVDILITSHHWRLNGTDIARDYRTEIAHAAIDAGADVVVAHGTHRVGEIEVYRGRAVFYGLGNFYFASARRRTGGGNARRHIGLAADIAVEGGRVAEVRCLLVRQHGDDDDRPAFAAPAAEPDGFAEISRLAQARDTVLKADGDRIVVVAA